MHGAGGHPHEVARAGLDEERTRLGARLEDAQAGLASRQARVEALEQQFGTRARWQEPDRVVELVDEQVLELAGLSVSVSHAPGHTEGSVIFGLGDLPAAIPADDLDRTVLSGDVLFAGSIGRTDLPGGDPAAMQRSLRDRVLPLPDSTLVLPGHGPATTMARERTTNPFLQNLAADRP